MNIGEIRKDLKELNPGDIFISSGKMFIKGYSSETINMIVPVGYSIVVNMETGEVNILPDSTKAEHVTYLELING